MHSQVTKWGRLSDEQKLALSQALQRRENLPFELRASFLPPDFVKANFPAALKWEMAVKLQDEKVKTVAMLAATALGLIWFLGSFLAHYI